MDPDALIDYVRPLIVEIDGLGTIRRAHGGFGGFLGESPSDLIGRSVFEFVHPDDAHSLATYFVESADDALAEVAMPMPFHVRLVHADGRTEDVDVIPTAREVDGCVQSWVVVIMPVSLSTSTTRSLDAEMAGAPRQRVKELLTEELSVGGGGEEHLMHWFLVDALESRRWGDVRVTTASPTNRSFAGLLDTAVTMDGWRPWNLVAEGEAIPLQVDDLPANLRIEAEYRGWTRFMTAPVYLDGFIVAAYLQGSVAPAGYVLTEVKANMASRIKRLADVTSLLLARWRDQDRLQAAATCDSLTGLANRDAMSNELATAGVDCALLYVDVDRFKQVNDLLGHHAGDRVLIEISRRIASACRPGDVVARYGGDEFVVLLRGVDFIEASLIAERIIGDVAKPLGIEGCGIVTVSIGIAQVNPGSDVLVDADRAMLHAKRSGRNQLVLA